MKAAHTTSTRRWPALIWFCVLLALASSLLARLPSYQFDSSILALLPQSVHGHSAEQRAIAKQGSSYLQSIADRQLLLVVSSADRAQSLALAKDAEGFFSSAQRRPTRLTQQRLDSVSQLYFPHRYFLLAAADAEILRGAPTAAATKLVQQAQRRLYSPLLSAGFDLENDPLWLHQRFLETLSQPSSVQLLDDWPSVIDQQQVYRLVHFQLDGDAFSLATQADLLEKLAVFRQQLPNGASLLTSGLVVHAAHGAATARSEISTVGIGSGLGVILLLWLTLRRLNAIVLLLASVAAGLLAAFCISVWVFAQVHLVTLAFGASLIGVGIDYGIHAWMGLARGLQLRRMLPALMLGLATSALAYGVQGMLPFPGLQQMALFSVVGLAAAWLSVVLWMPLLVKGKATSTVVAENANWFYRLADGWWRLAPALVLPKSLLLILVLALASVLFIRSNDSVTQLQTSPPSLLSQEAKVQALLGMPTPGRYFIVYAESETQLDKRLTLLEKSLDELRGEKLIGAYQSLHQWRPAQATQVENYQLLEQVYAQTTSLSNWFSSLGATALLVQARQNFVIHDKPLTLAQWKNAAENLGQSHLQTRLAAGTWMAFVHLNDVAAGVASAELLNPLQGEGVLYIDRVSQLSQLLQHYRVELSQWLLLAMVLALLLLLVKFGRAAVAVAAMPIVAAIVSLWLLASLDGINLFHCLATMLVLGIGFDSAIFLLAEDGAAWVWRAATLSMVTSLLSFGLLALSATPVLHFFGVVVVVGLVLLWLLLPCAFKGMKLLHKETS